MEIRGLTYDQDGALLVEEKVKFPTPYAMIETGCTGEVSNIYAISVSGSALLKKGFPLNGMTGYHTDLDLEKPLWGEAVTLREAGPQGDGEGKKTYSECSITNVSKQYLFDRERTVIEVSGAYCPSRKYASGIGLVDYVGLKLVRIEKNGRVVHTLR